MVWPRGNWADGLFRCVRRVEVRPGKERERKRCGALAEAGPTTFCGCGAVGCALVVRSQEPSRLNLSEELWGMEWKRTCTCIIQVNSFGSYLIEDG